MEIVTAWLHSLHFDDYIPLFLRAGYDLATIARANPQDLCMIGVNKPGHRKRFLHEIRQLKIADSWPETKPASVREWLQMIGLPEYTVDFERQGCTNMDEILQYTQEDFEDIGVTKLGMIITEITVWANV